MTAHSTTISFSELFHTLLLVTRTRMVGSTLTRKIGDVEVSAIGYGAMGLSAFYGQVGSDEERLDVGHSYLYLSIGTLLTCLMSVM